MTRFNSALRMSASLVALTAGAGLAAATAHAVTISGSQTEYINNGNIADGLTVATGATVTPGIILVTGNVAGDVINDGTVHSIIDFDIDPVLIASAFLVQGTVDGDVLNTGTVEIDGTDTADQSADWVGDAKGGQGFADEVNAAAAVNGLGVNTTTGDFTNEGIVDASAVTEGTYDGTATSEGDVTLYVNTGGWAQANGAIAGTLEGTFTNTAAGTISATADDHATISAKVSGDGAALILGPASDAQYPNSPFHLAQATGVLTTGPVENDGAISAASNAALTLVLDADGGASSAGIELAPVVLNSFATGIDNSLAGLINSGAISAEALSSVDISAASTGGAALVSGSSLNDLWSMANGAIVASDAVANEGAVTVSADADAVFRIDATATNGDAVGGAPEFEIKAASWGIATYGDSELDSFENKGAIAASSTASRTYDATLSAVNGTALLDDLVRSMTSMATGVELAATKGFSNSGGITATSKTEIAIDAAAMAKNRAELDVSYSVTNEAYGVQIETLDGEFANAGTISVSVNATETATTSAKASGGPADIEWHIGSSGVTAYGVDIHTLEGKFVNAADGVITVAVDNSTTHGATAEGLSASAVQLNGIGDDVVGAYLFGSNASIENAGQIDVNVVSTMASKVSATASDGKASANAGFAGSITTSGIRKILGTTSSFDNTGKISASSSIAMSAEASADGGADTLVAASSAITNVVYGVQLNAAGQVDGDISNAGTISANASTSVDFGMSSADGDGGGQFVLTNEDTVRAVGLAATYEVLAEGGAHSFDNAGEITSTASLSYNLPARPEGSLGFTAGQLYSSAVVLRGEVESITNTGSIAATGSVASNISGETLVSGSVIGLELGDLEAGLVITNSGKISATVEDTGAGFVKATAIRIGDEEPMLQANAASFDAAAVDVITLTNTGEISSSGAAGGSYGIDAQGAPVSVVINQQGGSIAADVAIAIDQGNADTLNWTGGEIHGVVDADALDVVNVFAGTGTPANKTVAAGADFALTGGAELNIGVKDAPVTFALDGTVTGTAVVNVNDDGNLLLGPSAKMEIGTLVMDPEAALTFEFDADSAGLIKTTGDAAIDGTLAAVALPDLYGDKGSHTIIETGGEVTGAFDNVNITGDTLLLDFSATVGEQAVAVSWERTPFDGVKGLSFNSAQVAGALEDGYDTKRPASKNTPELNDQLAGLFTLTDAAKYDRVLNSWSGSEHAQVMRAATNLSEPYLMAIGEHLNDNRNTGFREQSVVMLRPKGSSNAIAPASSVGASAEEPGFAFWGRAFGRFASTRGDANADGYDEDTYGAVLGMDFQVGPSVLLGIAGAYVDDDMDFDDGDAGKVKRWSIGGYASATFDAFYVDGSFTYASDSYRVHRTIITGGAACLSYTCTTGAASRYSGDGLIAHAEAGFNWQLGGSARLQPFAGLNFTSIDHDGFTEAGGGDLALAGLDGTGKSLQSRLGLRLSGDWGDGEVKWVPELRAEWRHEFEDEPAWIVSSLTGLPNDPFLTVGSHVGRDLAVVGAGITAQMASGWGLFLDYQGAFASGYNSHVIQGGVKVRF